MTVQILYTDTDAIRGVIGLEEADIPDAIITSRNLDIEMSMALDTLYPLHASAFDEPTENLLKIWSQYYGAYQMVTIGLLAIMQAGSANQDDMKRFDIDWKALADRIKEKIVDIEKELDPTIDTSVTMIAIASPAFDPITGV